jgi:hypothetical protein
LAIQKDQDLLAFPGLWIFSLYKDLNLVDSSSVWILLAFSGIVESSFKVLLKRSVLLQILGFHLVLKRKLNSFPDKRFTAFYRMLNYR